MRPVKKIDFGEPIRKELAQAFKFATGESANQTWQRTVLLQRCGDMVFAVTTKDWNIRIAPLSPEVAEQLCNLMPQKVTLPPMLAAFDADTARCVWGESADEGRVKLYRGRTVFNLHNFAEYWLDWQNLIPAIDTAPNSFWLDPALVAKSLKLKDGAAMNWQQKLQYKAICDVARAAKDCGANASLHYGDDNQSAMVTADGKTMHILSANAAPWSALDAWFKRGGNTAAQVDDTMRKAA